MASQAIRLMDVSTLSASKEQMREQVADLGAFKELNVQVRVLKIGTGTDANATLTLEHASVNEDEAFLPLSSASWRVDSTASANSYLQITGFLRYVRWATGSMVAGSPVAVIDLVAKE